MGIIELLAAPILFVPLCSRGTTLLYDHREHNWVRLLLMTFLLQHPEGLTTDRKLLAPLQHEFSIQMSKRCVVYNTNALSTSSSGELVRMA